MNRILVHIFNGVGISELLPGERIGALVQRTRKGGEEIVKKDAIAHK